MKLVIILGLAGILGLTAAEAGPITFAGTLFYTNWTGGGTNVNSISYSYDQGTQALTLGSVHGIATTPGADGIIVAPNGDLLVGGQGTGKVYDVNPSTGTFTSVSPGSAGTDQSSYHLSMDPSGTTFYTSNFGGALDIVPLPFGTQGSTRTVSGGDNGLTQIAFAPGTGNVFYVNGQPNGGGNLGTINLTTGVTTRLFTGVLPAHGLIYDPFTGLMTIFGAGETGTFDQSGANLKTSSSMACDFDQGAVDGQGHALVAGCNSITFIDYSLSHDITHPDKVIVTAGFNFIDDVAPLVGAGSGGQTTPEPSTVLLVGAGIAVLVFVQRKNATKANR